MDQKPGLIDLAGQRLELLGSGAVHWPERRVLLVADLHFGKAATYRKLGQPVPKGTTTETLQKLTLSLQATQATQLIVLGDFLHSALAHDSDSTLQAMLAWRDWQRDIPITLVRGNHDDRAGDPPQALMIAVVDEPYQIGPLTLRHDPARAKPHETWLAGHEHPVCYLQGRGRDRLRLPCFVTTVRSCLLPAFGAFTGGHLHVPQTGERLFVIAENQVYRLPGQT